MYSRKTVGPRMKPWGTPALAGYSCEDFPSRTAQTTQYFLVLKTLPTILKHEDTLGSVLYNQVADRIEMYPQDDCCFTLGFPPNLIIWITL